MGIRFKSLHREIQFVEAARQTNVGVRVFIYLNLVGNKFRFADEFSRKYFMNINEDRLQQKLQGLADESENRGPKMNESKTKMMMKNDTPTYLSATQRTLKATSSWERDTAPETKIKTRRLKTIHGLIDNIRPNAAISSMV